MSLITDALNKTKSLLISGELIKSYEIRAEEVKDEEGYIRIKAELTNRDMLELFEYYVLDKGEIKLDKYSFHWQKKSGELIKRWDNAPHHPMVRNFPHHVHFGREGDVRPGQETNAEETLEIIANEIEGWGGVEPIDIRMEHLA